MRSKTSLNISPMSPLAIGNGCALIPWRLGSCELVTTEFFYDIEDVSDERQELEVVILAIGLKKGNRIWIGGEEHGL